VTNSELRSALVKKVMGLGEAADTSAKYDAVEAFRHPENAEIQMRARMSVARADTLSYMAQQVVELINGHWPSE